MGTVTYKNQPGTARVLKAGTPLEGSSHIYRVGKVIWPEQVESFLQSLLIPKSLHVCCGQSKLVDVRFDQDATTGADFVGDAADLPFADESFESVLCDPPYNGKMQWNHDLLCELARVARYRIIFQHWFMPCDHEGRWKKWHKFKLTELYMWQPRTYFGRAQVISVFDADEEFADDGKRKVSSKRS